jgi:four and a half LIM domains protein 5
MCQSSLTHHTGFYNHPSTNKPICSNCLTSIQQSNNTIGKTKYESIPRSKCTKCQQNIMNNDSGITFSNKDYHERCFRCDKCAKSLVDSKQTFTDKNNNGLYCEPCFTNNFSPRCYKCSQHIPPSQTGTEYDNKIYHKECFNCARCRKSIGSKRFYKTGNAIICETCY